MRWLVMAVVLAGLASCCPKREVLRVDKVRVGCLDTPAPRPEPITLAGPDEGCPDAFELCAGPEAARRIETYLRSAQRWIEQAEIACGKKTP